MKQKIPAPPAIMNIDEGEEITGMKAPPAIH
jgi:hypothetical protein